jgi:SNF2 family DNA or RNA helicase
VVEGRPWFVFATRRGIPAAELASAPGLRHTGEGVSALPMDGAHRELVERILARNRMMLVDRRTLRCLDHLDPAKPDDPPPPGIVTVDDSGDFPEFRVQMLWDEAVLETLTDLPESRLLLDADARYSGDRERIDGSVVADPSTASSIDGMVGKHALGMDEAARELLDDMLEAQARGDELVQLSQAHGVEFEPPPGLTGELMPFQTAGVVYALRQRRVFIADEQGLGKTMQALATIESDNAYPAVVVCPASLKLNWLREIERWLPARTAAEISGRRGTLPVADIIVVNYDVLDGRLDSLAGLAPKALVFDESHYCKNPKAKRTKALIKLSERLAPDALRLALTGTPLVNHPAELVPQLRALRRLEHFGSGRSFKRRFRGEEARRRLHWHLRSSCYVRRRKDEVLTQLPPKRRITVPVPLTNEATYQHLEADLISWLKSEVHDPRELEQRIDTALRAEALVKLNALRHVAAQGKLAAAVEWIQSFVESDERLVVFAHHRDIQASLLDSFPDAARILGSDTLAERDENVQRFQADDGPHLCICSLEAASHGFTLTAAASVAFVELGWTPAKHEQAEDRVHRIGQERHVTAWYLLAADTIDERIAALIDHKRAVVGSVTDGTAGADAAVIDRLLRELAAEEPADAVEAAA